MCLSGLRTEGGRKEVKNLLPGCRKSGQNTKFVQLLFSNPCTFWKVWFHSCEFAWHIDIAPCLSPSLSGSTSSKSLFSLAIPPWKHKQPSFHRSYNQLLHHRHHNEVQLRLGRPSMDGVKYSWQVESVLKWKAKLWKPNNWKPHLREYFWKDRDEPWSKLGTCQQPTKQAPSPSPKSFILQPNNDNNPKALVFLTFKQNPIKPP